MFEITVDISVVGLIDLIYLHDLDNFHLLMRATLFALSSSF